MKTVIVGVFLGGLIVGILFCTGRSRKELETDCDVTCITLGNMSGQEYSWCATSQGECLREDFYNSLEESHRKGMEKDIQKAQEKLASEFLCGWVEEDGFWVCKK